LTTYLQPGESRRAYTTLANTLAGMPTPAGDLLRQIIAVEEVCPPGAAYAPPPLEWLTLFLTLHGHAKLRVGPHTLAHQPHSLIAIPSGSEIAEQIEATQPWHVRYLLLTGSWADQMDGWLRGREPALVAWESAAVRPRQLLSEMMDLALTQGEGWQWPFLGRCAELWGALYSDPPAASSGDAVLLRVAHLLDEAPSERPSVAEIASHLHLTPRQLIYRFHNAAGEPLAAWARRRRIAAAQRLLCQGWSVTSVAEQLGFANPYHFSRTFKAVTGLSPSTVREDAGRGDLHAKADNSLADTSAGAE